MINSIYEMYSKSPATYSSFTGLGKKKKRKKKKKGRGIVQQVIQQQGPQQAVIEEKEIKRGILPWSKKKKTKKTILPLAVPKMRKVGKKVKRECPSSVLCRPLAGPLEPYMYFALGGLIGVFVLRMMK